MITTQPLQIRVWQNVLKYASLEKRSRQSKFVGFAALNFTLKNETSEPISLQLETVEIRPIGQDAPLMSLPEREITLKPLETAPQHYQLSTRRGYGEIKWVEAIVTYQVAGKRHTLFSSPVYVQAIA